MCETEPDVQHCEWVQKGRKLNLMSDIVVWGEKMCETEPEE